MCACLGNLQGIERPHSSLLFYTQLILGEHPIHILDKALSLPCFHSQSVEQSIEIIRLRLGKFVIAIGGG